jgi:hypothetical protein
MKRKAKAVARFVKITCLFCTFSDMVIQRDVNVRIPQQNYSLSHSLSLCVCVCVYIYIQYQPVCISFLTRIRA